MLNMSMNGWSWNGADATVHGDCDHENVSAHAAPVDRCGHLARYRYGRLGHWRKL